VKLSEYQAQARRTLTLGPPVETVLAIAGLGLAGESGEVVELIKKFVGHGHELNRLKLRAELGDVLWYVAAIASAVGLDLDDVAEGNVAKLKLRYPDGFSPEASKARGDL
jgi:NTP pyrophosphatase (non-canonical NTP hydrolase)